jgi:hypothetical protein
MANRDIEVSVWVVLTVVVALIAATIIGFNVYHVHFRTKPEPEPIPEWVYVARDNMIKENERQARLMRECMVTNPEYICESMLNRRRH